ncbi:MAG: methyl-accepting chemotaxis protein [Desulfonatronovibrio sp.]
MDQDKERIFEDWAVRIQEVSSFLDTVITDKEQDFLDLGQGLHDISSRSGNLSAQADEMTALTSGERIIEAQQSLTGKLDDITVFCDVSWGEKSAGLLGGVLEQSKTLSLQMNDFKKIVRTLNVLSFTTRIESARLGDIGRGFMTLADDVEALGRKMVGHWQRILDEATNLYDLVESAKSRVEVLIQDQKTGVARVLEGINSNLTALDQVRQSSEQAAKDLSARAGEIASHIRDMVSSMQFHDITRQIVEHVQQTLNEVLNLIRQNGQVSGEMDEDESLKQLAGWINKVCALQIHQMDQAGKSFFEAVENLKTNLDSIAVNIEQMMDGLKVSLGKGEDEQQNVLGKIGEKISQVKSSIESFAGQSREIGDIMTTVGGSVSQMSSFVNDIEEVGSEIELIALNASVRAAHTGSEGMALGVVAVAIQQLSGNAREKTGAVTSTLNKISEDAGTLQELTSKAVDFSGFETLSLKIDKTLEELGSLQTETEEKLGSILNQGSDLAGSIRFLSSSLEFHHDVSRGMDEARNLLSQIVSQTEDQFDSDFEHMEWPENLKRMFDRYTMQSQRLVHQAQLEAGEAEPVEQEEPDDDSLGDNIELF